MHVIFLDIDGVLNSEAYLRGLDDQHRQLGHSDPARPKHETTCECYRLERQIDRGAVARLNRLVAETGAKIVVSSSWRKLLDPPELHRVLVSHGLVAEIIGETPDGHKDPEMLAAFGHLERIFRGHEIDLWLKQHPEVKRFVILDDGSDMEMHNNRLVQTDCQEGLLDEHVDLAIRVMLGVPGGAPVTTCLSKTEPCGNEDCDKCDPRPRWKISQHRVQHLTYTREIKAANAEEAMQIFEAGTAWPSSYDDRYGEITQLDDAVTEELPPNEYHLTECCYHDLADLPQVSTENDEFALGGEESVVDPGSRPKV